MKNIKLWLLASAVWLLPKPAAQAQNTSPNCAAKSDDVKVTGEVFFNYGAITGAFNSTARSSHTIGQPAVGGGLAQNFTGGYGFWSRFLLPPFAPAVFATEGDLPDRINVSWTPDPLSPAASSAFKIYRNGSFLATVDEQTFSFVDFNVVAGHFYTYQISGVNQFGEGTKGSALGFLNPNGVITGQVKTLNGNPVPDATVVLTPTIGAALDFSGDDDLFTEYQSVYPTDLFTVSAWVKFNATPATEAGILDFGSDVSKNWWMHTLPPNPFGGLQGVVFGIGAGAGNVTQVSASFPSGEENEWHHVAATYNGASLLIYLDGELAGTAVGSIEANENLLFFGKNAATGNHFNGKLDEVRIYETQLSQTQIQSSMNQTVPSNAPGLVAYWKFDEGVGTKAFDISENKIKAYLCGAAWSADKPQVVNAGVSDETGFYKIEGINYGSGTTFTATPSKNFYSNQSLEFNAVNEQYADLTNFDLPDSSTLTFTFKPFDLASTQVLLSKKSNSNGNQLVVLFENQVLKIRMGSSEHSFGALSADFHNVAVQLDQNGSAIEVTVFVDGSQVGAAVSFSGVDSDFLASGSTWTLGAERNGGGVMAGFFTGLMDEVAFYDQILSLQDIQLANSVGTDAAHVALFSYFNLNEGTGAVLKDVGTSLSGNGQILGATWATTAKVSSELPHEFTPANRLVTLNPSNTSTDAVDFTDVSTVPVSGFVRFDKTTCFIEGVEIYVNGQRNSPPIFTDADGKFVADFEPGVSVQLAPKYENHSFFPAFWEIPAVTVPVAGILFRDQTVRTLEGKLAGGACEKSIIDEAQGDFATIELRTLDNCFVQEKTVNLADGKFKFTNLPAQKFAIGIQHHTQPPIKNFFDLLGGVETDLTAANDTLDFIYFAPPAVELSPLPTNDCGVAVLQQLTKYNIDVRVYEDYAGGRCYVDTAAIQVTDDLATPTAYVDTGLVEGKFRYRFKAGEPRLVGDHHKTVSFSARSNGNWASASTSAAITGKRARGVTFATTSPQIPLLVLHDPPGDGSYAFLDENKTTCQTLTVSATDANSTSGQIDLLLGTKTETEIGLGVSTEVEVELINTVSLGLSGHYASTRSNSVETCLTTHQLISTDDQDLIVGSGQGGDLFMGGAVNLLFGVTDDLKFDETACEFVLDTGVIVFPDGFATTYIYTEYDIKNVVIPNALTIGDTKTAMQWQKILDDNDAARKAAIFEENISFSAGVNYEKSVTSSVSEAVTHSFEEDVTFTMARELGITVNATGVKGTLGIEITTSESEETTNTDIKERTVGYFLADDDPQDIFTVNVKKDKRYGTPVFQTVSGESMCPWEPSTVNREEVNLSVDRLIASNVPDNEPALFTFSCGNQSPTNDILVYYLAAGPESLADGVTVRANGVNIASSPLPLQIPPGETIDVVVEVTHGPGVYSHEDIEIALYSTCEDARAATLGFAPDTIYKFYRNLFVAAHFVEPCSQVNTGFPAQDWVILDADPLDLNIQIDGYDKNDPDMERIRVQYRRSVGDGIWINIATVEKADLGAVFTVVPWNHGGLADGLYEIRSVSECAGFLPAGISKVVKGRIEREAPELFGTPEPADGVLSAADEISIRFNEPVRCDELIAADFFQNNNVGLYNSETGDLVDAKFSCNGDKITLVPNVPNAFIENKVLRVEIDSVQDLAGNKFGHAQWEFVVDRNNLNWVDNVNVYVSKFEEDIKSETRRIENRGAFPATFEITGTPDWVRIFPKNGTLQAGQVQVVTFEFDSTMVFGKYVDTIKLEGSSGDEPLEVQCRVVCHDPGWKINAADWDYSHNFTVQLDIEGTVSTDIEDIVAAYVGNEPRGVAKLKYVAAVNKYEAFLTVYSNQFSGETINFRIWDASECLLYGSVLENFAFQADGLQGSPQSPTVLHTNTQVLREIELHSGWNWISFNLAFPNPSVSAALASVTHPTNDLVKSQTQFSQNSAGLGWVGSLTTLGNTSMYQYRTADRDTIVHLGTLIDPSAVNIPIAAGWNWIGYLPQQALPVNEALASLNPLNGDLLKSQTEFAQFVAGFGWIGNLTYLSPPNGYLLKMAQANTLTYPNSANKVTPTSMSGRRGFPDMEIGVTSANSRSEVWTVDPTKFEHSQTMIAMLKNDGANVTKADFELGAFTQSGECRGAAKAIWIEPLQSHLFFLTMYANQSGEVFNFKTADAGASSMTIMDLKETIFFAADAQTGSVQQPFEFQFGTSSADEGASSMAEEEPFLDVLPNPAIDYATIRFRSPEAGLVKFEIADAAGKQVQTFDFEAIRGMNAMLWQEAGNLPKGVYLLKLTAADLILTEKVVVR